MDYASIEVPAVCTHSIIPWMLPHWEYPCRSFLIADPGPCIQSAGAPLRNWRSIPLKFVEISMSKYHTGDLLDAPNDSILSITPASRRHYTARMAKFENIAEPHEVYPTILVLDFG